jgi:hypothetical protein
MEGRDKRYRRIERDARNRLAEMLRDKARRKDSATVMAMDAELCDSRDTSTTIPQPNQIKRGCELIQAEWSEEEKARRNNLPNPAAETPETKYTPSRGARN